MQPTLIHGFHIHGFHIRGFSEPQIEYYVYHPRLVEAVCAEPWIREVDSGTSASANFGTGGESWNGSP